MPTTKLMKSKWFPNPHTIQLKWGVGIEPATVSSYTNIPFCMYDEGQGTPSDLETNPENANFVVDTSPMIYPDSTVDSIFAELTVRMTKAALETDKMHAIRYMLQEVHFSFLEDYVAIDELSAEETQDLFHMTTESTDRQGFPLYNNVKLPIPQAGMATLHADVPGMDTTQTIEAIAYDPVAYYNNIHWKTTAGKVRTLASGVHWSILTRQRPIKRHRFRIHPSSKHANPYMYAGLIIGAPPVTVVDQVSVASEVTNVTHLEFLLNIRYNEWNENFNMKKV